MSAARIRRRLTGAAVAAAAGLLAVVVAAAPAGAATQRTTLYAVETQVMCVTCGIPLVEAQSEQADHERHYIESLIRQGKTMSQIKALLVDSYGDEVLALPPASGFNAAVYIVPIAVVVALVALVVVLVPRWRRRRGERPPPAAAEALNDADAARLDADLARFDA